jgi:hypothetical protein
MSEALEATILSIVQRAGPRGITMGRIVDRVVADGGDERAAENQVWELLQERRLTPHGFACRTLRKSGAGGSSPEYRSYEFVLIAWSPERDRQLDLVLDEGQGDAPGNDGSGRGEQH